MKKGLFLGILCILNFTFAQNVKILNIDHPEVSFRGLSVIDDYSLWVSGTKGTIGFTVNGGKNFKWVNPAGYEDRDFRGIEAISHQVAIAIAVGSPALILKTENQGQNWRVVFKDSHPDAFYDAVQFNPFNSSLGYVLADPIDNKAYILHTKDAGDTWERIQEDDDEYINMLAGEAYFAASNSNLYILDDTTFFSVSGGSNSRLMIHSTSPNSANIPKTHSSTSGANAVDYRFFSDFGLIAGGDFENPDSFENNLLIFELKKSKIPKISVPKVLPRGYKSGVSIINDNKAISCGLMGADLTIDKGQTWKNIGETPYHSCKKARKGTNVYLVGPHGRIGKFFD